MPHAHSDVIVERGATRSDGRVDSDPTVTALAFALVVSAGLPK